MFSVETMIIAVEMLAALIGNPDVFCVLCGVCLSGWGNWWIILEADNSLYFCIFLVYFLFIFIIYLKVLVITFWVVVYFVVQYVVFTVIFLISAGQISGAGNYAELPLDADAFRRLESVLESEEAREMLGDPLLDMVTNPEQLGTLDDFMNSSLFEGIVIYTSLVVTCCIALLSPAGSWCFVFTVFSQFLMTLCYIAIILCQFKLVFWDLRYTEYCTILSYIYGELGKH